MRSLHRCAQPYYPASQLLQDKSLVRKARDGSGQQVTSLTNVLWEPRHHAIITLDIEGFGSPTRTDPIRAGLRKALAELIHVAVDRLQVPNAVAAEGDTGDGKWLLFRSDLSKSALLNTLTPTIEAALRHHNQSASTAATLRLRIGVHHGEITVGEDGGYSGEPLNHAFRIIDNEVVRNALAHTTNDMVVAISDDFFQKVVKPGFGALNPDTYSPVKITVKETTATVWLNVSNVPVELPTARKVPTQGSDHALEVPTNAQPQVITLSDLPPSSLYIAITDIHNATLYCQRFPEAPIEQHVEAALLLADKVVLHCADAYRSSRVTAILNEFQPCIIGGHLLFLLGENTQNPRLHFRGYIDHKIRQYSQSDLGKRDVTSLSEVDVDAADRAERLLALSPFALIRGFSGADNFIRAAKRDLQPAEKINICEPFIASVLNQLSLTIRQLLDLTELSPEGQLHRITADSATVGKLQAEVNRLASHNSFSRQILMEALRRATKLPEDDPIHEALEERVSILHLAGTTGGMPHLEITNHRDRNSAYYYAYLLEHLSVLAEAPHPSRFGSALVLELRALPAWQFFASHHLRIVSHMLHQMSYEPEVCDPMTSYAWTRRIPEFSQIRSVVRRHWDQ